MLIKSSHPHRASTAATLCTHHSLSPGCVREFPHERESSGYTMNGIENSSCDFNMKVVVYSYLKKQSAEVNPYLWRSIPTQLRNRLRLLSRDFLGCCSMKSIKNISSFSSDRVTFYCFFYWIACLIFRQKGSKIDHDQCLNIYKEINESTSLFLNHFITVALLIPY